LNPVGIHRFLRHDAPRRVAEPLVSQRVLHITAPESGSKENTKILPWLDFEEASVGGRSDATAVKKNAKAMTAVQKRTVWSRSHLLTTALHSFDGASGRQPAAGKSGA
jgi:hypothetical protein